MNNSFLLQCIHIKKFYQIENSNIEILHDINFSIRSGETVSIVGHSGSGKSTLLHLMSGLENPNDGSIIFEEKNLNDMSSDACANLRNRNIGFIYQFHHLLLDFTVLENIAMPLMIGGIQSKVANHSAYEMLNLVGLSKKYIERYPYELSGGERQRVAIARALVNHPKLILADEPTGNLDYKNSENIFQLLMEFNKNYNTALIMVTHDLTLANRLNRQFEMCNGRLNIYNSNIIL
ncbi:lipoprotein-releasing ABC transporter ATP-binding protein LolD [Candidatus Schneideria nysicola]|uniref:lipoprotein-releasing ABC transporter ATP-binding protein LolD n=1 Tax=Candidatus Schneideria nysicola TaxID=1081631 RepID=UPI001CAA77C8|nr:lipoprotein-releasing ABC transporter ATP-binding protein LolD [Candidatus Schneideria nysicola]UAJ66322.1 lipoprotein-releasing ABC transporter ATP-binding protein LolD [Candidatus Schneideria nysicola]